MPEDKNSKTVDIDTSGPEVDVEFEDNSAAPSNEIEVKEETVKEVKEPSPSTQETTVEKQEASDEKPEPGNEKKDELEDYSDSVQRRIAKLTKKMREAERQKDEALNFAKIQMNEKEATLRKYSVENARLEDVSVKNREARIVSGLQAAQAKLAEARNAGDIPAEVEIQKEIAKLGYDEARLVEDKNKLEILSKNQIKPEPKYDINLSRSTEPQVKADPKAEAWGSKNKWFGSNSAMTYTAFDIHNKLEAEGYDLNSDEYYAEIDKRIRLDFPHKFDTTNGNSTKPVQLVASAKRSTKPGRRTVRLTPSQVAIAKKLGVPLEEYAKQLNITKEV